MSADDTNRSESGGPEEMKPSYKGFDAKQNTGNYITLPPVGAYEAEIQAVRFTPKNEAENIFRDTIELMIEITEGEYANRYHEVYENQKERFGDSIKYKGIFKLYPPVEGEESYDWRKSVFEGNLWAVSESNGKNADGSYSLRFPTWCSNIRIDKLEADY